ncbi:hypothetical protein [Sporolactobacillus nakayamae]|uniref:Uncharacterized protein n=1 Tax=Sporolactobacillus nakayamae TaxID=269670 RepID=A0A1I2WAA4_9BACL|nr:hypothetical protein [Sporolactobacillus nakayamae]SFG96431.1 hypothetical protein SAMN02982927_03404 [Sporolactobacillus nakayamae]
MTIYTFYHESDGKRTISDAYNKPIATIQAESIEQAAEQFSEKYALKLVDFESLLQGDYRVYTRTTRPLWKRHEQIYYVKSEV